MEKTNDEDIDKKHLTDEGFWERFYEDRANDQIQERNWKILPVLQIIRLLESMGLADKKVCEVGGGDAKLVCHLAKKYPSTEFSIIDYSIKGCELARERAIREKVSLAVYHNDLFDIPEILESKFDIVISHGVVEHFLDLPYVMNAKKKLLKGKGSIFTLIPNFSSPLYSSLAKWFSRPIYQDHVPHTLESFLSGHKEAGLTPQKAGYLGFGDFGLLSNMLQGPEGASRIKREVYKFLSRLAKVWHYAEFHSTTFPTSRLLSPRIYSVSTVGE